MAVGSLLGSVELKVPAPGMSLRPVLLLALSVTVFGVAAGCRTPADEEEETVPFEGVTISLSCAVPTLRGFLEEAANEWALTSGASVVFTEGGEGDILVFPLSDAGEVAAERMLSAVPEGVYEPDPNAPRDWPEPVRENLCHWGTVECFVPLSVTTYVLLVRTDLIPGGSEHSLSTWRALDELVESREEKPAIVVPDLTIAWLLRAASYARAPGSFAFFFDPWKGTPLVGSPGFERALAEWLAIRDKTAVGDARTFASGQVPVAIVASNDLWPVFSSASTVADKTLVLPLPGSEQYFNRSAGRWTAVQGAHRVSWFDAIMAAVPVDCPVRDAAFDFVKFCASPDISIRGVVDPLVRMSPFRLSHFRRTGAWVSGGWNVEAMASYLLAVQETLGNRVCVEPLQVRNRARFMEVLRDVVEQLWDSGQGDPRQGVERMASRWRALLDELGKEQIQEDYRRSVGLVGLEYMLPQM